MMRIQIAGSSILDTASVPMFMKMEPAVFTSVYLC